MAISTWGPRGHDKYSFNLETTERSDTVWGILCETGKIIK